MQFDLSKEKYLYSVKPVRTPKVRLVCFPYAGGSASVFREWSKGLPDFVEAHAIQLPGRANRLQEKPISCMNQLMEELIPVAKKLVEIPSVFLGYSNGALVAHELAHRLKDNSNLKKLIICARKPPHIRSVAEGQPLRHELCDADFLAFVRSLNGMPAEISDNDELMNMLIPMIRADFKLGGTYQAPDAMLDIPFDLFAGELDIEATPNEMSEWRKYTSGDFTMKTYNCGHFFLNNHKDDLLSSIRKILQGVVS
ncbi:thioesterase II family protein [Pleionea sediminis]|uniref:thioesterase II family protein n=1 Tax=Pleionea sediminis TaxID=2569479 RepID=UPI0013DDD83A|nr:thioesterase [Pleionea sediminis]